MKDHYQERVQTLNRLIAQHCYDMQQSYELWKSSPEWWPAVQSTIQRRLDLARDQRRWALKCLLDD